jgi:hypothetical protein
MFSNRDDTVHLNAPQNICLLFTYLAPDFGTAIIADGCRQRLDIKILYAK